MCGESTGHRWIPPTKVHPLTRKMFPFDDVIVRPEAIVDNAEISRYSLLDWCLFSIPSCLLVSQLLSTGRIETGS